MEFRLNRKWPGEASTIGELYIDGVFECCTLEDRVREIEGRPVSEWKIKGKTAIPRGRYQVKLTPSPRFKRVMPQLMDVPGFSGIRIHSGNVAEDTEGCLLVGTSRGENAVYNSKKAFAAIEEKLQAAIGRGEEVFITIS